MAPIVSKPDRTGEELRLELEALNQALQYRSHTRCKSYSPLLRHAPSPKRPLQPKPSFKVPFRSASFISCDRSKGPASPRSFKPLHHQDHQKKDPQLYQHEEKKGTHLEKKGTHQHQHSERKSFWRWRPLRAISHFIMSSHSRVHVEFSLLVHRIEGLPVPMNGLRLTVCWFCKNRGLQTMPSRIFHGVAEFGETLRHQCTVYGTRYANDMIRYDAKPSTLSIVALDVNEMELAKYQVDLSTFLVQNDHLMGTIWQEKSHNTSYELSGMAKGSTLIVSFSYEIVHHVDTVKGYDDGMHSTTRKCKKTLNATENLRPLMPGLPLIDTSDVSSLPPLLESGTDAASCLDAEQRDLVQACAPQDFSAENRALDTTNVLDNGFSNSFEFKPNLESSLEDEHRDQFSFVQDTVEEGPASFRNFKASFNQEEGFLMRNPFNNIVHLRDGSNVEENKECKAGTRVQSDQWKPQGMLGSGQEGSTAGQLDCGEANFMNFLQTEFDDEVDRIAEEFLSMLAMN